MNSDRWNTTAVTSMFLSLISIVYNLISRLTTCQLYDHANAYSMKNLISNDIVNSSNSSDIDEQYDDDDDNDDDDDILLSITGTNSHHIHCKNVQYNNNYGDKMKKDNHNSSIQSKSSQMKNHYTTVVNTNTLLDFIGNEHVKKEKLDNMYSHDKNNSDNDDDEDYNNDNEDDYNNDRNAVVIPENYKYDDDDDEFSSLDSNSINYDNEASEDKILKDIDNDHLNLEIISEEKSREII